MCKANPWAHIPQIITAIQGDTCAVCVPCERITAPCIEVALKAAKVEHLEKYPVFVIKEGESAVVGCGYVPLMMVVKVIAAGEKKKYYKKARKQREYSTTTSTLLFNPLWFDAVSPAARAAMVRGVEAQSQYWPKLGVSFCSIHDHRDSLRNQSVVFAKKYHPKVYFRKKALSQSVFSQKSVITKCIFAKKCD